MKEMRVHTKYNKCKLKQRKCISRQVIIAFQGIFKNHANYYLILKIYQFMICMLINLETKRRTSIFK